MDKYTFHKRFLKISSLLYMLPSLDNYSPNGETLPNLVTLYTHRNHLSATLCQKLVMVDAIRIRIGQEVVAALPESGVAPQEDPALAVVQGQPVVPGLGPGVRQGQVGSVFAEK
jgi:hypothetical protein